MEGTYVVTFADGSTEEVQASDRTKAKDVARNMRFKEVDPGGRLAKDDPTALMGHKRVKIASVLEKVGDTLVALLVMVGLAIYARLHPSHASTLGPLAFADVLWLQGYFGTAIGATLAAAAAVTGDSLQIPTFGDGKKAMILNWWTDVQFAGTARIKSSKWHDNVNGLRHDTLASFLNPVMPWGFGQRLDPGDNLTVDLAGSSNAGDLEYVLVLMWFESLNNQQSYLVSPDVVQQKIINYSLVENTIATGTTAAWTGAEAINAEIDQFHAKGKYALLGYAVDTEVSAIAWSGPDTANVHVGGPGIDAEQDITMNWFTRLSKSFNKALIPVIQADNKAATMISTIQDENGADTTVIAIYGELGI